MLSITMHPTQQPHVDSVENYETLVIIVHIMCMCLIRRRSSRKKVFHSHGFRLNFHVYPHIFFCVWSSRFLFRLLFAFCFLCLRISTSLIILLSGRNLLAGHKLYSHIFRQFSGWVQISFEKCFAVAQIGWVSFKCMTVAD